MFGSKKRIKELEAQLEATVADRNELQKLIESAGGNEVLNFQAMATRLQSDLEDMRADQEKLNAEIDEKKQQLAEDIREHVKLQKELREIRGDIKGFQTYIDFGLAEFEHPAASSVALEAQLANVRSDIKHAIRNKTAYHATTSFTFNNSSAQGRRFVESMAKMMLRAYNAEAENCVLTVKAGNGEAAFNRLNRARDQVAKLGKMIDLEITTTYHSLRLDEIRLALEYQNAKRHEKELEREEKARLREEKRAQKELEAERARLEKEKGHYEQVLASLREQGRDDEAAEIEAKLQDVEKEISGVDFRAANIRAGYVYVISNIGAFGDGMVKIGMTRRLDPMDRIRELSDASVPFVFDVHALFFSEDAVGVETELHHRFADKRVNKVNMRREFFYATPAEVKEELVKIAGNLLEFTDTPEADQYRQSLELAHHDSKVDEA